MFIPSRIGLDSRICCSSPDRRPLMAARYWRISLELSVFPAPDSPLREGETESTGWEKEIKTGK